MSYTPLRIVPFDQAAPAKVATPATPAGGPEGGIATLAAVASPPSLADHVAERAAIIEEGAKVPREWAEAFARVEAMSAPAHVDPARWQSVVDAAGRFLDAWGAKAAAVDWTAAELFGLDPAVPLNRRDRRGAAYFLADTEVLAHTAKAVTLRVGRDELRVYRRRRSRRTSIGSLRADGRLSVPSPP
jgi:hypothetical protein